VSVAKWAGVRRQQQHITNVVQALSTGSARPFPLLPQEPQLTLAKSATVNAAAAAAAAAAVAAAAKKIAFWLTMLVGAA